MRAALNNTNNLITKKINVHFFHGYVIKKPFRNTEEPIRGGFLGGHVYFQLKNHVYGFEPINNDKFHVVPRIHPKRFNSNLKKEHVNDWLRFYEQYKFTSIEVLVSQTRFIYLKNILKKYKILPPYDYALLGVRCASFTHYLLTKCGVCRSAGIIDSIIRFPYPRKLRFNLLRKALKQGWRISETTGTNTRIWEENQPLLKTLHKQIFT